MGRGTRVEGRITRWHDERGYGFITPQAGGRPVFVHVKAFERGGRRPQLHDRVGYVPASDRQGRPCAANVRLSDAPARADSTAGSARWHPLLALAFLALLGVGGFSALLPAWLPAAYLLLSVITFLAYAFDKAAARRGAWRVQESTLHLLAIGGGWPGALIAQQQLRHKSQKESFRAMFWVTVVFNGMLFGWLVAAGGAADVIDLVRSGGWRWG